MSETIERLAHPKPELDVKHAIQSPHTDEAFFNKRTASTDFPLTKVSFGPFRLLPTQFLLLEGENPVPLEVVLWRYWLLCWNGAESWSATRI
jgi:hypothetical protein